MQQTTIASESEIRREVAELLLAGPRGGVARVVAEVRSAGLIRNERGLELKIKALCAQNTTWISEFKKRTKKRSKCPQDLRHLIHRCLTTRGTVDAPDAKLTAGDVLRRMRKARSKGTLTIKQKEELGLGKACRFFLANLHTFSSQHLTPIDLSVHFQCERVYVHGLALLAAWCERYASAVRLTADSTRVERYLDATGFKRVVEEQVTIRSALYDRDHHVALTRVDREDQAGADEVAGRLVDLFDRHIHLVREKKAALTIMFAELVENVYRHARSNYGTYVMAQAFPKTRKLHVVVADTGIGIFASFRESDSPEIKKRAKSESEAINMALEKLVTSNSN